MTAPLNYRACGKALTREIAKKQDFTLVHGELAILAAMVELDDQHVHLALKWLSVVPQNEAGLIRCPILAFTMHGVSVLIR